MQARFQYKFEFNDLVDGLDLEHKLGQVPVNDHLSGTGSSMYTKTNKDWRLEASQW